MLAVSPFRGTNEDEIKGQQGGEMGAFSSIIVGGDDDDDGFGEFSEGSLLESINFEDFFVGINVDVAGDELPDLEMGPEILSEFSSMEESSEENMNCSPSLSMENIEDNNKADYNQPHDSIASEKEEEEDCDNKVSSASNCESSRAEEIVSKRDEGKDARKPSTKEVEQKGRKSSGQSKKNSHGKRKVKVDWTPELHSRFVQAVEQLGVDKAVPSKILDIMGIPCLTRHNIASHLQKYRSHRKHLLAREAEAARWSKRREMRPWAAPPTVGFPPLSPSSISPQYFRPFHVWGHPTTDHYSPFMVHWQPPPPPTAWPYSTTLRPPPDPSFWHSHHHHHHQVGPKALAQGMGSTYCFQPPTTVPVTTTGYGYPPFHGIPPPHGMLTADPEIGSPNGQPTRPWPVGLYPSKESIDEALEEVISKPWLPLPLGLKAPEIDSVLSELQRQGIPKVPPSCS